MSAATKIQRKQHKPPYGGFYINHVSWGDIGVSLGECGGGANRRAITHSSMMWGVGIHMNLKHDVGR